MSNDGFLTPIPTISVLDRSGILLTTQDVAIVVTIRPDPISQSGIQTVSSGGIATFDSLRFKGEHNRTYALTFSSGGLTPVQFDIYILTCDSIIPRSVPDYITPNVQGSECVCPIGMELKG